LAKKKADPVFNYVIARPWSDDRPDSLCIYTIFSAEVQRGTMLNAQQSLEYVQRAMKIDGEKKEQIQRWGIYVIGAMRIS
jgi:hypothetical protein